MAETPFVNSTNGADAADGNLTLLLGLLRVSLNSSIELSSTVVLQRQWVLPIGLQLVYITLFGIMVLVAVFGNALVVWSVLYHRRMNTVTNRFLVNLSIADTMTAVFNAVFNLVYMLESHWALGERWCIFSNFLANMTVASSAFTMTAMSIDRYDTGALFLHY